MISRLMKENKAFQQMCIEERIETYEGGYPYSEACFSQEEEIGDYSYLWEDLEVRN